MSTAQASSQQLDLIFHALADSTRRTILQRIAKEALSVSDIALPFNMSLAAVSKHLKVLERAGLINRKKQGRTHFLILNNEGLASAEAWIAHYQQFWRDQLESLQALLEEDTQ